jgi:outer membrane lipoprotein-sorting protein
MQIALLSLAAFVCADAGLALGAGASAAAPEPAPIVVAAAEDTAPTAVPAQAGNVTDPEAVPEELVFAGESDDAVAQRIIDYVDRLDTLQGDFTQVAPSGAVSTGRFYLRRPGLLRFEYDPPSPLLIVATGGMVFVRDDELETTDSYPVGKTPLKFLLRKRVELAEARLVAVDRGPDSAAITFASAGDEEGGEISLIVSAPNVVLERWVVRDPQSGVTIVTLDNVVSGEPIPNRLFAAPEASSPFLKN